MKVIEDTRDTRSDFIVISDVYVVLGNKEPQEFVGNEFHAGVHHRIEDPNNRVVANCQIRDGHQIWVPEAKVSSGPEIAGGTCGIGPATSSANILSPRFTQSPMTTAAFATPGLADAFIKEYPPGRVGTSEDIANASSSVKGALNDTPMLDGSPMVAD